MTDKSSLPRRKAGGKRRCCLSTVSPPVPRRARCAIIPGAPVWPHVPRLHKDQAPNRALGPAGRTVRIRVTPGRRTVGLLQARTSPRILPPTLSPPSFESLRPRSCGSTIAGFCSWTKRPVIGCSRNCASTRRDAATLRSSECGTAGPERPWARSSPAGSRSLTRPRSDSPMTCFAGSRTAATTDTPPRRDEGGGSLPALQCARLPALPSCALADLWHTTMDHHAGIRTEWRTPATTQGA